MGAVARGPQLRHSCYNLQGTLVPFGLSHVFTSTFQATSRIRKDVASLATQATELHATVNSAQALGISGGGGGGGKSVAEIVEMAKEIQALTKKVEKLKTQKKSQVRTPHVPVSAVLTRAAGLHLCRTRKLPSFRCGRSRCQCCVRC